MILVELTCPAGEGFEAAALRKESRYTALLDAINDRNNPWSAKLFTIESGARGFVAYSMLSFLKQVGFANRTAKSACKKISLITAKCFFEIFLQRESLHWDSNREPLDVS